MSRSRLALVAVGLLLLTPTALYACLWDYDTLQVERSRFPSALELITGKFLRHSPEFYEWRVEDRKRRLNSEPNNLGLYDDLAVAYSKLGQHDKAIETILVKEKRKPGEYETYANLGTFYIFAGEWEKSVVEIDKALAINPDAHFGREKYQKYLVQYVLTRRKDGKVSLPLARADQPPGEGENNFYQFVLKQEKPAEGQSHDVQPALKAVLGMMRFAYYDSPILLEVLGDLLAMKDAHHNLDGKRLAARAYLKASYEVKDETAKDAYRKLAKDVLAMQTQGPGTQEPVRVGEIETSFKRELDDANAWYADLQGKERDWIKNSPNPEAEFDRLYQTEPKNASPEDPKDGEGCYSYGIVGLLSYVVVVSGIVGIVGVMAAGLVFYLRRKPTPSDE